MPLYKLFQAAKLYAFGGLSIHPLLLFTSFTSLQNDLPQYCSNQILKAHDCSDLQHSNVPSMIPPPQMDVHTRVF